MSLKIQPKKMLVRDKSEKKQPLKMNIIDFNKYKLINQKQSIKVVCPEYKISSPINKIKTMYRDKRRKMKQCLNSRIIKYNQFNAMDSAKESTGMIHSKFFDKSGIYSSIRQRALTQNNKRTFSFERYLEGEESQVSNTINSKKSPILHIKKIERKEKGENYYEIINNLRKSFSSKFRLSFYKNKNSSRQSKKNIPEITFQSKYSFEQYNISPWQQKINRQQLF